jgi:tetratricopeptide (TPR) repeat protein
MKKITLIFLFVSFAGITIAQNGVTVDSSATKNEAVDPERRAFDLINISSEQMAKKDFAGAIKSCLEGLEIDNESYYLLANLAHSYILSGDYDNAISIYRRNYGRSFDGTITWKEMIKRDFESFKSEGFDPKLMDQVLADLKSME